jgi:hypothetical protein
MTAVEPRYGNSAFGREMLTNKATLEVHGRTTACRWMGSPRARREETIELLQMISCSQHSRAHKGHFYLRILTSIAALTAAYTIDDEKAVSVR